MKVKCDHRSKFSNLSNWKEEAWKKKSGLQRDSNAWPPRYRCDALPTELWSHTLGARSIAYLENVLRWSSSLSSTTAVQIWIISYILDIKSWLLKINYSSHVWVRLETATQPKYCAKFHFQLELFPKTYYRKFTLVLRMERFRTKPEQSQIARFPSERHKNHWIRDEIRKKRR